MIIVESSIFNDKIATLELMYPDFELEFHKDFEYNKKKYRKGQIESYKLKGMSQLNDLEKHLKVTELPYDFFDKNQLTDVIDFLR